MSDTYEQTLEAVRAEMAGQPPAIQIEYRVDSLVRELDELLALANEPATADLVDMQRPGIGQIYARAAVLQSSLLARLPASRPIVRRSHTQC